MLVFYSTAQNVNLKFVGEIEEKNIEKARRHYYLQGYHAEFLRIDEAIHRKLKFTQND
jgi:hypothetical protein